MAKYNPNFAYQKRMQKRNKKTPKHQEYQQMDFDLKEMEEHYRKLKETTERMRKDSESFQQSFEFLNIQINGEDIEGFVGYYFKECNKTEDAICVVFENIVHKIILFEKIKDCLLSKQYDYSEIEFEKFIDNDHLNCVLFLKDKKTNSFQKLLFSHN